MWPSYYSTVAGGGGGGWGGSMVQVFLPPKQSWRMCIALQDPALCLPAPACGWYSRLPRLTGPGLFVPFCLQNNVGWVLSAGRAAAILRVAKWHSGVHWWKGLHACTRGGRGDGFSEGHYKERRCKIFTGGEALLYKRGRTLASLVLHLVYLVSVMHKLDPCESTDPVRTFSLQFVQTGRGNQVSQRWGATLDTFPVVSSSCWHHCASIYQ